MNELHELTINCRGAGADEVRFKISGVGVARAELKYIAAKYSGALDLKAIAALHEWTGQFLAMHEAMRTVSGSPQHESVAMIAEAIKALVRGLAKRLVRLEEYAIRTIERGSIPCREVIANIMADKP